MAEVLTGDGIRAIELPVGGDVLVSGFLARPWTTSRGVVRLVAAGDRVLVFVLVPQMIVSLVQLAAAAANPDLRRRFAADAAGVSIDACVNIDVAIIVDRCVIVGLKWCTKAIVKHATSHRWTILLILSVVRRRFYSKYITWMCFTPVKIN